MSGSYQIHFLLLRKMDGYVFNPHRPEGLTFLDTQSAIKFEIKAAGDKDDFGFGHRNLELRATVSQDLTERQFRLVEALLNKRTLTPSECPIRLPYVLAETEVVTGNGLISEGYSPTSDFLPEDLQTLCITAGRSLAVHATRFLSILRWVTNSDGPAEISKHQDSRFELYWKTTQTVYHSVPWPKQDFTFESSGGGITWRDKDQQNFSSLWDSVGIEEPLGHQLLRDAKSIVGHNDRSALLICYSALEVGIKQHISNCAPDASWIVKYAPTPPLFNILRDYLPQLHGSKDDFKNWAAIKPELAKVSAFTEDRNRLAHHGESIRGSLNDYVRVTEDILIALDVFEGRTWAKEHVSSGFGRLLGWPPNKDKLSIKLTLLE